MVRKKKFRLLLMDGCPVCQKTKDYFDKKKIVYEEINIDEHPELQDISFAPIICKINKNGRNMRCLSGFSEEAVDKLIKEKNRGKRKT